MPKHRPDWRPVAGALVLLSLTIGWAAVAEAQDGPPSLITLDRMNDQSHFGVQVGFHKFDNFDLDDGFAMRFELHGQFLLPGKSLGLYGHIPFSHAFIFAGDGDDATGNGNLEGGAYYLLGGSSGLILRAGLSLPTASDGNDEGFLANGLTSYERLTDIIGIFPDTMALRLSASTLQEIGVLFLRGDFGFDLALDNDSESDLFMRINLALGIRGPGVDVAMESANIGVLDGPSDDLDERFLHSAAFSIRTQGANQLHAGMVFPLDENVRGEVWIVSLGYQRAM